MLNKNHEFKITSYLRSWKYKETSNKSAEYRTISNPGADLQYNLHFGTEKRKNTISFGGDLKFQDMNIYKLKSAADPLREESIDQTNIETDTLLANQVISQQSTGVYGLYMFEMGKFNVICSGRYDLMNNKLTDKMMGKDTAVTTKKFSKTTVRIGASYCFSDAFTIYTNWSQGFIPPSTEELASNPVGYSGFNTHLIPATSGSIDAGVRGFVGNDAYYEITGFLMNTENDFFRFKQTGRGNQEVFYGNAGNSRRTGLELFMSYKAFEKLSLQLAYTFAAYQYTSATIDPVYTDTAYVLTTPPAKGQWLPNSPKHQLFTEAVYKINKYLQISVSAEHQSKWAIYTDARAYNGELDPAVYKNWQHGFTLYHARISCFYNLFGLQGECSISGRNLADTKYMAFTEPDPDGNSYQPGPGREIFFSIKIRF